MTNDTKKCPMCAEEIKAEARVCRFCGTEFEATFQGYCANCHGVVQTDEAGKCLQCGTEVIDRQIESRVKEGSAPGAVTAAPLPAVFAPPPAAPGETSELILLPIKGEGVINRWSAIFIDGIIISLIYAMAIVFFSLFTGVLAGLSNITNQGTLLALFSGGTLFLLPVVWFLYFFILEGAFGITPGKASSFLRVIRKDGGKISWGQAAIRALFSIFEANIIGAIVIWSTPLKQRIADLIAGTLVVNKEKLEKVDFQPQAIIFQFHDYRRVAFSQITEAVLRKFGVIKDLFLRGSDELGHPLSLTIHGQFFAPELGKMDVLRHEIERIYKFRIPEKLMVWRLVLLIVILLFLVTLLIGALAIPSLPDPSTWFAGTPKEVSFDSVGYYSQGTRVSIAGYLRLPGSTHCDTVCGICLNRTLTGSSCNLPIFINVAAGNPSLNTMERLPSLYSSHDLVVMADNGQTIGEMAYVRIIGSTCRTTDEKVCVNRITKIIYAP